MTDPLAPSDPSVPAPSTRRRPVVVSVALIGLLAAAVWVLLFAVPHGVLDRRIDLYLCQQVPVSGACSDGVVQAYGLWLFPLAVDFLGWALACVILVAAGRRILFVVPALASVLVPPLILSSSLSDHVSGRFGFAFAPSGLWTRFGPMPPWISHAWLGAPITFLIVLAPAVTLLVLTRDRQPAPRFAQKQLLGMAFLMSAIAGLQWVFAPFGLLHFGDAFTTVTLLVFGMGLGLSTRWRLAVVAAMPLILTGVAASWAASLTFHTLEPPPLSALAQLAPWEAIALLAAATERFRIPLLRVRTGASVPQPGPLLH